MGEIVVRTMAGRKMSFDYEENEVKIMDGHKYGSSRLPERAGCVLPGASGRKHKNTEQALCGNGSGAGINRIQAIWSCCIDG